jgi:hypothetical protein
VRSTEFVERMQPLMPSRQETEIAEAADGAWALRETERAYGKEAGLKTRRRMSLAISKLPKFSMPAKEENSHARARLGSGSPVVRLRGHSAVTIGQFRMVGTVSPGIGY